VEAEGTTRFSGSHEGVTLGRASDQMAAMVLTDPSNGIPYGEDLCRSFTTFLRAASFHRCSERCKRGHPSSERLRDTAEGLWQKISP
jgi:hypothetical protein